MNDLKNKICLKLKSYGFNVVGITKPQVNKDTINNYNLFLKKKYHGDMYWLENHENAKKDPSKIWKEVKTIIVLGLNYAPGYNPLIHNDQRSYGNISVYAQNEDYHTVIKDKLKIFKEWLLNEYKLDSKIFVDTSPIFEKQLAQLAGLGWQGKHTNLVSKKYGSWLFLSEIFLPIDIPNDNKEYNHCGICDDCIKVCPTDAILKENVIDARKCISYLTIEHKGPFPISLRKKIGNKIYGCDDCLSICPWNKFSSETKEKKLIGKNLKELSFYLNLNENEFYNLFKNSPIKRIGWIRFLRNVIICSGNSDDQDLKESLIKYVYHPEPIIRGASIWSLSQIISKKDFETLKKKLLKTENNSYVLFELNIKN